MNSAATVVAQPVGALAGQTVVVIGGTSGIGLAVVRQARSAGADLILTGRDPGRLAAAGAEVGAVGTATLDLRDAGGLQRFFGGLPEVDRPRHGHRRWADLRTDRRPGFEDARRILDEHLLGSLRIATAMVGRTRPGGSLTLITGTHARRPGVGLSIAAIAAAAVPVIAANIAVELAPIRANAIAAGFVDTPLSAKLLGTELEDRRAELRATLPIRRVVGPADVAALVIHLMTNTAVTGSTFDIDGGQQLIG